MSSFADPRVVCGLDTSDHAPAVVDVAESLAAALRLPLDVVHSCSTDVFVVGEERDRVMEDARDAMAEIIGPREVRDVLVEFGPPTDLLRTALSDQAVLAVVGARGRGPLRTALLGSVSAELARSAPCPVVIVPPHVEPVDFGAPSIVCRLDGSSDDPHTVRAAIWIAAELGGRLSAVNVRARPSISTATTVRRVERELESAVGRPAIRVETGDVIDQIREVADMHDATMLVVGSRGESLGRSSLVSLIGAARRPVMAVSPTAEIPDRRMAPAQALDVG